VKAKKRDESKKQEETKENIKTVMISNYLHVSIKKNYTTNNEEII
tara:strand:- start:291 stop:425 length:135 start_codon:yes stop_codon:yes gene_type:complete